MKHFGHVITGLTLNALLVSTGAFAESPVAYESGASLLVSAVGDNFPQPVPKSIMETDAVRVGALTPQGFPALTGQGITEVDIGVVEATTGAAAMQITDALDTISTMLPGLTIGEARHLLKMSAAPTYWFGVGRFDRSETLRRAQRLAMGWPESRKQLEGPVAMPPPGNVREYLQLSTNNGVPILRRLEAIRAAGSQGYKDIVEGCFLEGLREMMNRSEDATDGERLVTVSLAAAPKHMIDLSTLGQTSENIAVRLVEISSAIGRKDYAAALIGRVDAKKINIAAAAAAGQIKLVKWLIKQGAPIAGPGRGGLDPLVAASAANDGGAVARFLIENGVKGAELLHHEQAVQVAKVIEPQAPATDMEAARTAVAQAAPAPKRHRAKDAEQLAKSLGGADYLAAMGIVPTP